MIYAAGADAEVAEPSLHGIRIHAVALRERRRIDLSFRRARLRRSRQCMRRGGKDPLTPRREFRNESAHIAQQNRRAPRNAELRLLPHHEIARRTIARIARRQINHDFIPVRGSREFQPQLLLRHERRHRLHPGLRPAHFPDVSFFAVV